MTGTGEYSWNNNDKYVGDWVGGMRHGNGTFVFANGNKYTG